MRVTDVMTDNVKTVPSTTTLAKAASLMKGQGVHHLAVMEGGDLVGIVSSRDLDSYERHDRGETVKDVATRNVVTVTPETPIRRAANIMRGRSIGSLVVLSEGRVVGIITVSDLLSLIGEGVTKPIARVKRWTLKHRVPHTKKASQRGTW